ncbi:MAG: class I SAM-dependent methyltransferase [Anaerolineae bacterium]
MFIDNLIAKDQLGTTGEAFATFTRKWQKEILLRLIDNRKGWKVLIVCPGMGKEIPLVAHMLGDRGEITIIDTNPAVLEQIEANKKRRLYTTKSTKNLTMNGPYKRNVTVPAAVHIQPFDGVSLDFLEDTFDLMWCPLGANQPLVDEFYRVVRPGGFVVIGQPHMEMAR